MSEIRKKAMTRLVLCAVALVACIIFSVLLLSGTLDGKTGGSQPASGDTISSSAPVEGVDDPTADNFTAESTPAEEAPAEPEATPEPTPEPTPVPEYEGLSVQPTTYYNEGEQPTYTVTDGNNLNMRGGPGTDYDKIGQVPASTGVTALGTNEDGSWVVVNYNGTYGWLKQFFSAEPLRLKVSLPPHIRTLQDGSHNGQVPENIHQKQFQGSGLVL